jgi:hypothetical protein
MACPKASERRFHLTRLPQPAVAPASPPRPAGELKQTISVTRYPVGCAELVDYRKLGLPQWVRRSLATRAWESAADLWHRFPAVPKWGSVLVLALSAGVLSLPDSGPHGSPAAAFWREAQESIMRRAAIDLSDDFRSGLANWVGEKDPAESWSYDQAGFIRIGELALFQPTLNLSDYRLEFVGQIEKKALAWVVRARDTRNYYAMRLTQTGSGAVPAVVFERYPVVEGKPGKAVERKLNLFLQRDTLYEVALSVNGENYSLTVQGKIVDSWRESQLRRGGVGFFAGKGEQARLRWVGVRHQDDAVGKLCALLAPYGLQDRKGSLD